MKFIFITIFTFIAFNVYSQKDIDSISKNQKELHKDALKTISNKEKDSIVHKRSGLYINVFSVVLENTVELSYDYALNKESCIGVSISKSIDMNAVDIWGEEHSFSLVPYYDYFFSKKYGAGFYIESFAMYTETKDMAYIDGFEKTMQSQVVKDGDFMFGFGMGYKFVSKDGFTGKILIGLGRKLKRKRTSEVVIRDGIMLGISF